MKALLHTPIDHQWRPETGKARLIRHMFRSASTADHVGSGINSNRVFVNSMSLTTYLCIRSWPSESHNRRHVFAIYSVKQGISVE
jgi:hypothetical protein